MHLLQIAIFMVTCFLVSARLPYRPKTEKNVFCMIPFQKNGKTYHNCTLDGKTKPWCILGNDSTKTDFCAPEPVELMNCNVRSPNVSFAEVNSILGLINNIRSQEPALNMAKLRWNVELAGRAQYMSDQCQLSTTDRNLCNSALPMGQFSYLTMSSVPQPKVWSSFILSFVSTKSSYNIDTDTCKASENCLGYKQLVNAKTTDVGCAVSSCKRNSMYADYYYCNFYPPLYVGKPYEKGNNSCDSCYKLDSESLFRCSQSLCEICDSPASGCVGRKELEQSGKICDDSDPQYCQLNSNVCPYIHLLQDVEDQNKMRTRCRKTCGLCK